MFGSKKRAVRARIAQAGLSAEVSRFIAEVVRRTRLRRAEQVEQAASRASDNRPALKIAHKPTVPVTETRVFGFEDKGFKYPIQFGPRQQLIGVESLVPQKQIFASGIKVI